MRTTLEAKPSTPCAAEKLGFAEFSAEKAERKGMGRAGIEPATHGFSVHCSTS
jgi:hypothetical protein